MSSREDRDSAAGDNPAANRTVVVVGSGSSLGRSIVKVLAPAYGRVVCTYHSSEPGPDDKQDGVFHHRVDVSDPASVKEFFGSLGPLYGDPYAVVFVAGVLIEKPLMFLSVEDWKRSLDVNLTGAYACLHAASRGMMVGGAGRFVLVGSIAGRLGTLGQSAYAASKAGLEALARVVAVELGRYGVTVNVVAPGAIDSGMFHKVADKAVAKIVGRIPSRRLGMASEVAATVQFLLTDEASFINGQTIVVDGGMSIS